MGGRGGGWRLEDRKTNLLEEHGHGRDNNALEHGPGLEELPDRNKLQLERVPGGRLAELGEHLGNGALLKQRLRLDLEELDLEELVVSIQAAEIGQNLARFLFAAVVDQPAGREGHEDHADEEEKGGR